MAVIQPWQGLRYIPERLGRDLSAMTAPPYDIISPELHRELAQLGVLQAAEVRPLSDTFRRVFAERGALTTLPSAVS